jgi:hypothetical protein
MKDNEANGGGDGANGDGDDVKSGKDGGTDGSGEKNSSDEEKTNDESDKENKANSEGDDGCGDGDNGSDDNHNKKSSKEGGYEKKPRPSVNNLVMPEKTNLTKNYKTASQRFPGYDTKKQKKTKTRKRKRMAVQYNESDVFTNCVKTYQKTLNHQIFEHEVFFNYGIKNHPTDCTVTKKQLKEIKKKLSMESKSKFALVPFFSVLERNFKIDLRLSAFAQMFTYILYCPNIAKCHWLL